MKSFDERRVDLAREFKARPFGSHSAELQRILNILRSGAVEGRYILVSLKPHEKWALAQLTGDPANPVRVFEDQTFDSLEAAEWCVFKLRWKIHTGTDLPVE